MPRKAMDKVQITPELMKQQKDMRAFLRNQPKIEWKEIKPIGFSINISTIPEDAENEFLRICYQHKTKTE
jgi:hypothetical protein